MICLSRQFERINLHPMTEIIFLSLEADLLIFCEIFQKLLNELSVDAFVSVMTDGKLKALIDSLFF